MRPWRWTNSLLSEIASNYLFFLTVTRLEDVGALVEDNLFERDILIATKILGASPNITERTQGNKPASQSP